MSEQSPKQERFKLIPAVYLLAIQDEKVLLLRRFQTGYEDGNYSLVAGHLEGNETAHEAMIREAHEEAGISIVSDDLTHALTMHRWCGDHERIDLFFYTSKWVGDVVNKEMHKCDDVRFAGFGQLPVNTIPYIRTAIECYRKGITYCEFGWDEES